MLMILGGWKSAEQLVLESCPFEAQITIVRLKRYKSPDIDQIMAEMIQEGSET
jgi:hypothetical protein